MSICLIVILALSVSVFGHVEEGDDVTLDVAIKLKREYYDDVVSDLFATSHNLIKISRVILQPLILLLKLINLFLSPKKGY